MKTLLCEMCCKCCPIYHNIEDLIKSSFIMPQLHGSVRLPFRAACKPKMKNVASGILSALKPQMCSGRSALTMSGTERESTGTTIISSTGCFPLSSQLLISDLEVPAPNEVIPAITPDQSVMCGNPPMSLCIVR